MTEPVTDKDVESCKRLPAGGPPYDAKRPAAAARNIYMKGVQ